MNCREAAGLLGAWHDRELDLVRSVEIEAHVRECAACGAAVERMEALRSVVARHAPYYSAPERLRAKLAAPEPAPRRPWFAGWPSMAAASAAAALLLWIAVPRPASGTLGKEVAAAHVRSLLAEHLMDVPSSDRHTVKPWFAGKVDFAPQVEDLSAAGFVLAGGRLDYLDGRTVAALVYRRRQHTINVFTWPAGGGDQSPRRESIQGFNEIHWTRQGMNWWAVSDLSADELAELARLL